MTGINILIYSGNGTSPNSVRHTQHTLKLLLGHAYDIVKVDAQVLRTEPWEESCAMLVVPGGRDKPYCNDLNGVINDRIKRYVRAGGRYLGLCAGAYYASRMIEFEMDRPDMQVCGKRELAFFPGLCRGTVYPGFVYDSERGARSAPVQLDSPLLQPYYPDALVPKVINMYYNGGGYFVRAFEYPDVEILGRFVEPGICKDEEHPAAAVQCRVGDGTAVLISTHPEYDMGGLSPHENASLVEELKASEEDRKTFLRVVFARMGLQVVGFDNKSGLQENQSPALTPIYLSAINNEVAQSVASKLRALATESLIIKDGNDRFRLLEADDDPVSSEVASLSLTSENDDTPPPPLQIKLPAARETDPVCPAKSLTPHFDLKAYFTALAAQRSQEWGGGRWLRFGNAALYAEVITSTQTVLDKNYRFAQALPTGLVCLATNQIAGRGRGRNSWVSQLGALQFSFIVRHSLKLSHAPVVFIQYIIALAIVESIRSRKGYESVPLRLKWPNDIYAEVNGGQELKKVGGLLVNSSFAENEFLLVIGCGVNLSNPRPTISINEVIQAHDPSLRKLSPEEALAGFLVTFERFYLEFCEKGMGQWFLEKYYARWLHSDKIVTLTTHNNECVKITGITSDYGMLEAVSIDGSHKRYTLQPDGNSFDMLKGLIIKKA